MYLDAAFCIESTSVLPGRSTYGHGLYTQRSREWVRRLGMGGRREEGGGRREERGGSDMRVVGRKE